jgi:hypothetical protein
MGRGLVVLTSCSHRGVVNAIKQSQAASGIKKVPAVIGGFHRAPYNVQETIAEGNRASIAFPLHCTSEPCYEMAKSEMLNKVVRSCTGHASYLAPEPDRVSNGKLASATAARGQLARERRDWRASSLLSATSFTAGDPHEL